MLEADPMNIHDGSRFIPLQLRKRSESGGPRLVGQYWAPVEVKWGPPDPTVPGGNTYMRQSIYS